MAPRKTWIRDIIIGLLLAVLALDQMNHQWDLGYDAGLKDGYLRGLAAEPKTWKTVASPPEIV
jgi:hypothetical protein